MHKINHANIKDWAKDYDGELFDGILCDPPYELGFMGKSWDSSGIAFDTEMWGYIYKLLKPGAHLLAFSGSRTYHRMAVAIEDAGFEIRDMIEWVYGSGFPKSFNIAKALESQELTGSQNKTAFKHLDGEKSTSKLGTWDSRNAAEGFRPNDYTGRETTINHVLHTENAIKWQGYGTALKPAHEPCVLARKPIEGTVANNVLKHGTGGLNIDGTRITSRDNLGRKNNVSPYSNDRTWSVSKTPPQDNTDNPPIGRFPANLIHDGSDEVEAVFPQTKNGGGNSTSKRETWLRQETEPTQYAGDKGSASRFFYTAKASKSERNAGLEGFEDSYIDIAGQNSDESRAARGRNPAQPTKNHHPTVKPLSLTKYLATLIKPPTGGRLLVPFSGSGSEMIGALQAGWEYVEGVELTEEYIPIAEARIKYWLEQMGKEQISLL